jgi:flagellar basal-body rod protein FlgC
MDFMPGIGAATAGLDAQRIRLEAIAQNLANTNTTQVQGGGPYQRQVVTFAAELDRAGRSTVRVDGVTSDQTAGPVRFDPSHPHADEEGMVHMPNVSLSHEMVDMLSASRAYEANLSVVKTSRHLAQKALEIGR